MIDMRYLLEKDARRICNAIEDESLPDDIAMAYAAHELIESAQGMLAKAGLNVKNMDDFNDINNTCVVLEDVRKAVEVVVRKMRQDKHDEDKGDI